MANDKRGEILEPLERIERQLDEQLDHLRHAEEQLEHAESMPESMAVPRTDPTARTDGDEPSPEEDEA